jgi:hypothetical protein
MIKGGVDQPTRVDKKIIIVGLDPTIFLLTEKLFILEAMEIRRSSRRMTKRRCRRMTKRRCQRMTKGTSANHKREASVNDKKEVSANDKREYQSMTNYTLSKETFRRRIKSKNAKRPKNHRIPLAGPCIVWQPHPGPPAPLPSPGL